MSTIEKHLRVSGRVALSLLVKRKQSSTVQEFSAFLRFCPVLVGSSVSGVNLAQRLDDHEEDETFMLSYDSPEDALDEDDEDDSGHTLHRAIYPLVKDGGSMVESFTVGRGADNDLIMADFAISKHHALIKIKLGQYLVTDCGSTNGTFVNDQRIKSQPHRLQDRDIVTFARYEFAFVKPETLYRHL